MKNKTAPKPKPKKKRAEKPEEKPTDPQPAPVPQPKKPVVEEPATPSAPEPLATGAVLTQTQTKVLAAAQVIGQPLCDLCQQPMQFYSSLKETHDHEPGMKYVFMCGCPKTGVRYQSVFISENNAQS